MTGCLAFPGARVRRRAAAFLALLTGPILSCFNPTLQTFAGAFSCTDLTDMAVDSYREIRMVALYTQGAAAGAIDIEGDIELAFLEMNVAFQESGIPVRAVLTHMQQVTVTEPQPDSDILQALIDGTGALQDAHTLRTKHHADIVALVTTSFGGLTRHMLTPSLSSAVNGFLLAGRVPMGQQFTLAHEVGHVLGGVDGRPTNPLALPRYRYAFARACTTCVVGSLIGWHTMMGTPVSFPPAGLTTRIGLFSNPDVLYFGQPTGVGDNEDNRKTLTHTSTLVAAFRLTPVWFASLRAEGPWFERRVDDALMPDIRIGDFDGNGQSDAFRVDVNTNEWFVSNRAAEPWKVIFTDPRKVPLQDLRFADFNGDGTTEVFHADLVGHQWLVWRGGTVWDVLNTQAATSDVPVKQLAFGDLDGDRKDDVFWSDASTGAWSIASAGAGPWTVIKTNPALKFDTEQLRLAHFDNDATMDVFRSNAGTGTWYVSRIASAIPWETLNGPNDELKVDVTGLAIGDFDGDGIADVLSPAGYAWGVAWSGKGSLQLIKLSCAHIGNMALGDFDGDRSTDVLRAGIRP